MPPTSPRTDRAAPHTTSGALPTLIDVQTLAGILGVNVRHIRRLVAERRIPFVKWGHLLRFDPTEIAAWVDQHRLGATVRGGFEPASRLDRQPPPARAAARRLTNP